MLFVMIYLKRDMNLLLPRLSKCLLPTQRLMTKKPKPKCRRCWICLRTTTIFRMYGTTGKWTDFCTIIYTILANQELILQNEYYKRKRQQKYLLSFPLEIEYEKIYQYILVVNLNLFIPHFQQGVEGIPHTLTLEVF